MSLAFDPHCRRCPRLTGLLDAVRSEHPDYHCAPVAPFGPADAHLLVVGLALGKHGANASGRPFTGDHAGIILYRTLYRFGFADRPESRHRGDGLRLLDCRITNAVKCLPPANRPTTGEVRACNGFLGAELAALPGRAVILTLGAVAHGAVLRALGLKARDHAFGPGYAYDLAGRRRLLASYHCSRYNTQTRRLTPAMFDAVFAQAREWLDHGG